MALTQLQVAPDLVEQVYTSLLNAISVGEMAPGARLTQEELAEQLAVSRQPVLQALGLLKRDGLVVDAPGRGLMVAPLDATLIAQLYEVRSVLDGLAARQAALAKVQIDRNIIVRGRKAVESEKIGAMLDADIAFHQAIYAASRNPLIAESAGRHWRHIRRASGAMLQAAGARAPIWDEHEAILQAVARGDAARAERLARGHCEAASINLCSQLSLHASAQAGS
ncbi:MAG: GntR family transcriptional regulator [Betaproteobacteria bacterium]|nr:GntR family transcriptional regulator [Betaproteobacteria bacterium]